MYQAFQEGRVQDAMKAQINANRVISVLMSFRGAGRHQGPCSDGEDYRWGLHVRQTIASRKRTSQG